MFLPNVLLLPLVFPHYFITLSVLWKGGEKKSFLFLLHLLPSAPELCIDMVYNSEAVKDMIQESQLEYLSACS